MPDAVRADALRFHYGDHRALDDLSFSVPEGSVYAFLGPNGSGKTTLFRILATLLPVQEGAVQVLGRPLATRAAAVRRELGVTFQSPSLDLRLTVEENLRHHGHLYGLRGAALARRLDALLERFGLEPRRRDRAEALSGGLRRRVELAKALLPEPRLLLLDEPSTGLDPRARRELGDLLAELAADGVTVLVTTHFIDEAERAHRLLLLDRGRRVAEGTPDALIREVGGEVVTLESAGGARELAAELGALLGELGSAAQPEMVAGRVRFELDVDGAAAWDTVARLARRLPGWEERVDAVTVARPDLEDVFLHRTGHRLHEAADERRGRDDRTATGGGAGEAA